MGGGSAGNRKCGNIFGKESTVKCECAWTTIHFGCFGKGGKGNDDSIVKRTGGVDLGGATCSFLCQDVANLRAAIERTHRTYYATDTTEEGRIEIEIELSALVGRSFEPSTHQTNYWTYITPTGQEKMSLCSEGLCDLMGGRLESVDRAGAEAAMRNYGIVFFHNKKQKPDCCRDSNAEKFQEKFVGGDEHFIVTPTGCFFSRLLDKNKCKSTTVVLTRRGEGPTGDMVGGYLVGARKIHGNHKAVQSWIKTMTEMGIVQWDYEGRDKAQKKLILGALEAEEKRVRGGLDYNEVWLECFGHKSQTYTNLGTLENATLIFREELLNGKILLRRVMILDADAIYPSYQCEPGHSLVPFLPVEGNDNSKAGCRVQLERGDPWVDHGCISYVKKEVTQAYVEREARRKEREERREKAEAERREKAKAEAERQKREGATQDKTQQEEQDKEQETEEENGGDNQGATQDKTQEEEQDETEEEEQETEEENGGDNQDVPKKTTVDHYGGLCLLKLDKDTTLAPLRWKALQATGADYSNEYLGEGNLAVGGFKRMSIVLKNAADFSAFVEYRKVGGGADHADQLNSSFGDLLGAIGFGADATEREEIQTLEKLVENVAIYASKGVALYPKPVGQEIRDDAAAEETAAPQTEDPNYIHWKFSNGLRGKDANGRGIKFYRDDVTAVVQQARLCGVRDYRMSDEMVVQLPGLPIAEADLMELGRANIEVYEVIIPLDRDGLLVFVTPQRNEVLVVEGNDYTEQEEDEDDKILLFLQYGTALVLPATTHYSTHHRTSMTGGLHIKTLVTVSKKEFGDNGKEVKPQIAGVPLGNVAVGYAGPVGVKIPKNARDNTAGNSNARKLTYTDYEEKNGQFGKHLIVDADDEYIFPRLFSVYCLPAKFGKKDNTVTNNAANKKRQSDQGGKKKSPAKKQRSAKEKGKDNANANRNAQAGDGNEGAAGVDGA
jgi:hypothetical protein